MHRFNIGGTYNVFEASKQNDVRRIIFASSGGTMLGYEMENPYTEIVGADYDKIPGTWTMITDDMPIHLGYVSKVFGEALRRMYSDQFGVSVLNIRLGPVLSGDVPVLHRYYPGYLSHADCVQFVQKRIDAPDDLMFDTLDAMSDNNYRWRDICHTKEAIGFVPTGSAEDHETEDKGGTHQVSETPTPPGNHAPS